MYEALFACIESEAGLPLTQEEQQIIRGKFGYRRLRKRQFLLQEGDICTSIAFIISGSARMYSVDQKGQEHIVRFGLEGLWLGDHESCNLLTPSRFNIEMLEHSELLVITMADLHELRDLVRPFDLAFNVIDRKDVLSGRDRIHAAICMNAEERYDDLMRSEPAFIQRFPQNMIASYLGVSPETLCRIRKHAKI